MRIRVFAPTSAVLLGTIAICGPAASAADATVAKVRNPPSVCVGLGKSACATKSECYWRKATHLKSGKTRRAHCRIKRSAVKSAPA